MRIMRTLAAVAVGLCTAGAALAQDNYPSRTITVIVPYTAGGTTDIVGRIVAEALSTQLDVPVIVENQPGATGLIGLRSAAQGEPDGYTLVISTQSNQGILPAIDPAYPTELVDSLVPIGMTSGANFYLVVSSASGIETPQELVEYLRQNPGTASYGSSGVGTNAHFIGAMLNADLDILHIPFQSSTDPLLMVGSGELTYNVPAWAVLMSHVDDPDLRVIGTFAAERTDVLPDVPTMVESGFPDFVAESWQGLYGPPGLPDDIRDTLSNALIEGLSQADVQERFSFLGLIAKPTDGETLGGLQEEEAQYWLERAGEFGISLAD